MNGRQRIVLVVGLGAICAVAAVSLSRLLATTGADWFAYGPSTSVYYQVSNTVAWRDAAIWVVAVIIWTAASYLILRGPADDGGE